MKIKTLAALTIVLVTLQSGPSTPVEPLDEFYKPIHPKVFEYQFPEANMSTIISVTSNRSTRQLLFTFSKATISEIWDVSVLSFDLFLVPYLVNFINISLVFNDQKASNSYFLTSFRNKQRFTFIIDEDAFLVLQDVNLVNISFSVGFGYDPFSKVPQFLAVRLQNLSLKSVYRGYLNPQDKKDFNNRLEAIILNPNYEVLSDTSGIGIDGVVSISNHVVYTLDFLVVLPSDLDWLTKQSYLNLTLSCRQEFTVSDLILENFAIISSVATKNSVNYILKYRGLTQRMVAQGIVTVNPTTSGLYNYSTVGEFFINNEPARFFRRSNEMSIGMFLSITLVIPIIFLSKLFYRRLIY